MTKKEKMEGLVAEYDWLPGLPASGVRRVLPLSLTMPPLLHLSHSFFSYFFLLSAHILQQCSTFPLWRQVLNSGGVLLLCPAACLPPALLCRRISLPNGRHVSFCTRS